MNHKEKIHTTITKRAKGILEDIGGKGGMGDLISKLALQLDGGKMEQIVIDKHFSLPEARDEIIFIDNDPISALQGGIFKNAVTLIVGNAGTGKFSIIANMILELSLSQKSVLLVTPKAKDKVEKALKTIFIVTGKKVSRDEEAITLDLKITKPSILYDLAETLDKFVNKPILVLDHLEELVDFDPQRFRKNEWLFFNSCLKRNKITVIATASIDKNIIINNSVLGFDSIFYLTQSPVLMDGKSRLARYIITFKSPKGTIPPTEFLLEKNWQVRLDEKKSAFARLAEQKNTKNTLQESRSPESLEKIARSSSAKPHAPEEKKEPPAQEEPIAFRILAKNGDVLFDPEESHESADLEITPIIDIETKYPEPTIKMEPKPPEIPKIAPVPVLPQTPQVKETEEPSNKAAVISPEKKDAAEKMETLKIGQLTMDQQAAMAKTEINLNAINFLRLVISNPGITRVELRRKMKCSTSAIRSMDINLTQKGILIPSPLVDIQEKGLPIMPNLEKIKQEFCDLIKVGLLPLLASEVAGDDNTNEKIEYQEKHRNALPEAVAPELKKPVEKAEAPIAKTGPRDASPAEIAMKIDMMKRSALNFPNAPTNGKQIINQSAPLLTEVLLNDFSAESLRVFAKRYKDSGKYDELVAYIAASLPAILREKETIQQKEAVR